MGLFGSLFALKPVCHLYFDLFDNIHIRESAFPSHYIVYRYAFPFHFFEVKLYLSHHVPSCPIMSYIGTPCPALSYRCPKNVPCMSHFILHAQIHQSLCIYCLIYFLKGQCPLSTLHLVSFSKVQAFCIFSSIPLGYDRQENSSRTL